MPMPLLTSAIIGELERALRGAHPAGDVTVPTWAVAAAAERLQDFTNQGHGFTDSRYSRNPVPGCICPERGCEVHGDR